MKTPHRPPPDRVCRARPSKRLVASLLEEQGHRCLACKRKLKQVEFDHVIPLGLGGTNALDNWAALCPACHHTKTAADLRQIAKAKRQRRYHETGRSRAPSTTGPMGKQRGFDRSLKKHFDGTVTRRCGCEACSGAKGRSGGADA